MIQSVSRLLSYSRVKICSVIDNPASVRYFSRTMALVQAKSINLDLLEFKGDIQIPVPWGHLAGKRQLNNCVRLIMLAKYFYIEISAKVWGPDDGFPMLALHGWLDNAGSFDQIAPLLPSTIRLVCLDTCGMHPIIII